MSTSSPRPRRVEERYPPTYRATELALISRVLRQRASVLVCGLGGSGKSHLLRFLALHVSIPERGQLPSLVRFYLDCNAVLEPDVVGFFNALLLEVNAAAQPPATATAALVALRTELATYLDTTNLVVVVLDRFDRLGEPVQAVVLDGLRHLRDYLDRRVSFVLGSRTPPAIAELSPEFEDLFTEPRVVWVGPLGLEDARQSVQRLFGEYNQVASEPMVSALYIASSGHARLLRAAARAVAEQPTVTLTTEQLLQHQLVAQVCASMWEEIGAEGQQIVQRLAQGEAVALPDEHQLRRYGLVADTGLTSPLLAAYVREQNIPAPLELTALEQQLWDILARNPLATVSRFDLITQLYGDNAADINDEALSALAARLRRKLTAANMGTLKALRGQGYRFEPRGDQ